MKNEIKYEEKDDLKEIERHYGKKMARLCRELFPTILEKRGLLFYLLSTHFAYSKILADDIINNGEMYNFKNYIFYFYDNKSIKEEDHGTKTVKELLASAGYALYECKTNADIQRFKHFYAQGEELCTFNDPHRIDNHHIFFIVKQGAEFLKRQDFIHPQREDEYGSSVLDLQFDKGTVQRVSIKSRYNHTVKNPDAAFGNNLDSIVPGLTAAFERDYGFRIDRKYEVNFSLDDYVEAKDGKLYKFNYEIDNVHYCANNIILDDGEVIDTYVNRDRYLFLDQYILDLHERKIIQYKTKNQQRQEAEARQKDRPFKMPFDSFVDIHKDIKKIQLNQIGTDKEVLLHFEGNKTVSITIDINGRIISYKNNVVEEVKDDFLSKNVYLREIEMNNLKKCGHNFVQKNELLHSINFPNLKECGNNFMRQSKDIENISMPKLEHCGNDFLFTAAFLKTVDLPSLISCKDNFLYSLVNAEVINMPALRGCGDYFMYRAAELKSLNLPSLEECGDNFMEMAEELSSLKLPKLRICGENFMFNNYELKTLFLPCLRKCGSSFFHSNTRLTSVIVPKLEECGDYFLPENERVKELDISSLIKCGDIFLSKNKALTTLLAPNLEECGKGFFYYNSNISKVDLRKLRKCKEDFMSANQKVRELDMPCLEECGDYFFSDNRIISRINMPRLVRCGRSFMCYNLELTELNLPSLFECDELFMANNKKISKVYIPGLRNRMLPRNFNSIIKELLNNPTQGRGMMI